MTIDEQTGRKKQGAALCNDRHREPQMCVSENMVWHAFTADVYRTGKAIHSPEVRDAELCLQTELTRTEGP